MFTRILFPVDFSDRSRGGAHAARALAQRFRSEIIALHVAPDDDPAGLAEAESKLQHLESHELGGCDVSRCVVSGDAASRIVQLIHDRGADLVVMPTHGLSRFRQFQLGSVTAKVLRLATCPVWTSSHLEDWPVVESIPLRSVLCALDFGPRSCTALQWASRIAKEFGAKLILSHIVRPGETDHLLETPEHTLQRQQGGLHVPSEIRIVEGTPAPMLSGLAEEVSADLMIIGRTHASSAGLGANAYAIIAHSPCPVLSV
jgi:nucleotide-binding universal stress UspA family protein